MSVALLGNTIFKFSFYISVPIARCVTIVLSLNDVTVTSRHHPLLGFQNLKYCVSTQYIYFFVMNILFAPLRKYAVQSPRFITLLHRRNFAVIFKLSAC